MFPERSGALNGAEASKGTDSLRLRSVSRSFESFRVKRPDPVHERGNSLGAVGAVPHERTADEQHGVFSVVLREVFDSFK